MVVVNNMNIIVVGIVIKQVDYKDNDVIVTVIDKDSKLYSFYARGIRKPKSKNSFACSLFSESEFVLQTKDNKRYQLLGSNCLKSQIGLFKHYEKLIYANIISDIVYEICQKEPFPLYDLLEETLTELSSRDDFNLILSLFLVSILKNLGIQIIVDSCSLCDSKLVNSISIHDGGFLCENCRNKYAICYEEEILKKFRYINKARFDQLNDLEALGKFPETLIEILYQFLNNYTGLSSRSIQFLQSTQNFRFD